jgi:DNA-binding transcriptional regulator YiaG
MIKEENDPKANEKPVLRYSFPPYYVGLVDGTLPIAAYPGDLYESLERGFAPSAEEVRQMLLTLRRELRWSRSMLSAFLGVSHNVVRRWETGERNPSGAARRLIWLLNLLAFHPKKLKTALDLILWGKGEECLAVSRHFNKPVRVASASSVLRD